MTVESLAGKLGAMGLPSVRWPDGRELTPQIDLRERLDLYAGLRPIRLYHAQDTPLKRYGAGEIDLVIVRENLGCQPFVNFLLIIFQQAVKVKSGSRCRTDHTAGAFF
jgi:isocitrate/isopropylmalate dehydrogenase